MENSYQTQRRVLIFGPAPQERGQVALGYRPGMKHSTTEQSLSFCFRKYSGDDDCTGKGLKVVWPIGYVTICVNRFVTPAERNHG